MPLQSSCLDYLWKFELIPSVLKTFSIIARELQNRDGVHLCTDLEKSSWTNILDDEILGKCLFFCAQNSSGTTSQLPINHSQNILVIVICVPRQCFLIVVQLTITKNQVCAVESTMSRSGNNVVLSATWVGIAGIEWEWRIAMLLFKWWWWQENWIFISQ